MTTKTRTIDVIVRARGAGHLTCAHAGWSWAFGGLHAASREVGSDCWLVPRCHCTEPFLYHEKFTGSHSTVTNRSPRTAPSGEGACVQVGACRLFAPARERPPMKLPLASSATNEAAAVVTRNQDVMTTLATHAAKPSLAPIFQARITCVETGTSVIAAATAT